nr:MAG TPA: Tail fiber protein [Bacteriophage sp.]
MTPAQKNIVADILKGDLKTASHQRLIELCLLYEAAPDAHDTFPAALKTELERRFTAAEIGKNDVLFAVLQKKANGYQSAIPLFHQRLLEMAGTVNRDIWFTDNKALFESAIADADVAKWLVKQHDILEKCLHNRLALAMLAASTTASSAILSDQTAVALWKNAPALWDIWPKHAPGMAVIAKSSELTQYIVDTAPAFTAIMASKTAWEALATGAEGMRVIAASAKAIAAVIASQTAMAAVAGSQVAMAAVAGSQVAMAAVAGTQIAMALAEIVQTATGRAALIAHNDNLQAVRQQIYDTIKTDWKRKANIYGGSEVNAPNISNTMTNPLKTPKNALVFACLGRHGNYPNGVLELQHPGGSIAARTTTARSQPTSMIAVDGISFGGAIVFNQMDFGYGYAELWAKE